MKQEDLNLEFSETEFGAIKEDDYYTVRSDLLIGEGSFESQNAVYWNNFRSKNDVLFDFSIECDHSQDETGIFFHGDAKLDNTLGELSLQDNLIAARSNLGLELESDTVLINNEELPENNYNTISGELVEERMGLNLEGNGFSVGACFECFGTIDENLFGGDKLKVEDAFLSNNSNGEVGFIPLNDSSEHHISGVTLFSNEPVTVALSTKYLSQQDIFSQENPDLDTLMGVPVESPHTFANYQNGVMDIGATYEHEEVVVKDTGNSLQTADGIHIATSKISQIHDGEIHFEQIVNTFEDEVPSRNNAVNVFPNLNSSMVNSCQAFQIEEGINSKAFEATLNDSLILENNLHRTDNFCGLINYISNDFNNLQPHKFVEEIIGISIEETEKKIERNFYLIGNNGVMNNNNFYLDEVILTN